MSAAESLPPQTATSAHNCKLASLAVEVVILTNDHEIHGLVHVSRDAREDRRITDLLNDPVKRFLAITDARLISRQGPATPRIYRFLQIHIDNIIMIHPAIQSVSAQAEYSLEEATRFNELRSRLNQ
jgi:hypothetical protein